MNHDVFLILAHEFHAILDFGEAMSFSIFWGKSYLYYWQACRLPSKTAEMDTLEKYPPIRFP